MSRGQHITNLKKQIGRMTFKQIHGKTKSSVDDNNVKCKQEECLLKRSMEKLTTVWMTLMLTLQTFISSYALNNLGCDINVNAANIYKQLCV